MSLNSPAPLSEPKQLASDEEYNSWLKSLGHVKYNDDWIPLPISSDQDARLRITALSLGSLDMEKHYIAYEEEPSHELLHLPDYGFIIEREVDGKVVNRVLFDLGLKQVDQPMKEAYKKSQEKFRAKTGKSAPELLQDELKLSLEQIDAVILSHTHFDHIGDLTQFPASVELVLGADSPSGQELAEQLDVPMSCLEARTVRILNREKDDWVKIGAGWSAVDYFGDNTMLLLHCPGHYKGHIAALVQHSPNNWLIFGGDCCHLHTQLKDVKIGVFPSFGNQKRFTTLDYDIEDAYISLSRLSRMEQEKNILVFIAHDELLHKHMNSQGQVTRLAGDEKEFNRLKASVS